MVSQENGTWRRVIGAPGLSALDTHRGAEIDAVSCGAAGSCVAVGLYDGGHGFQGFVLSQDHGVWEKAQQVPGLTALNKGQFAEVDTVSCASAGNCTAGGSYLDRSSLDQAFVVSKAP